MGLRPARTCRDLGKTVWSRFSKKKPRKSFVKAMPHNTVQIFHMGNPTLTYDAKAELYAVDSVQIRDNSLESARQAANKYLEKVILGNYYLQMLVYPHNVIRENKMILGAGADRLQKGMRKAYGRPMDRAARVYKKQSILVIKFFEKNEEAIKEALRRAKGKLPGSFEVKYTMMN